MAKPNRAVARWRASKPTFQLAAEVRANSRWEGEQVAHEIRESGYFARVQASTYKIGPRDLNQRNHVVRCYHRI